MLKYVDTKVVMSEIPDMITLAINISNCPNNCIGCHSSYLKEDVGTMLTDTLLQILIDENPGIDCVCFMGGDSEPWQIKHYAAFIKHHYPELKTAWYSGSDKLHTSIEINLHYFDYIKMGPYIEELGPLTSRTTNQRLYEIKHKPQDNELIDITHKFWK